MILVDYCELNVTVENPGTVYDQQIRFNKKNWNT